MYVLITLESSCRICCDKAVRLGVDSKDMEVMKGIVIDAGMSCISKATLPAARSSDDHWLTRNDSSEMTAATGCKHCTAGTTIPLQKL